MKNKNIIRYIMIIIYLILIQLLFINIYKTYKDYIEIIPWSEVKTTNDYTYMNISKISEKIATIEDKNQTIHFVIEKDVTGKWHTYLISIDADKYDNIVKKIENEYEIMIYGYPVLIGNNLKVLSLSKINEFLPSDNEIKITKDNFDKYLTNTYLDTTISRYDNTNYSLIVKIIILLFLIILLIFKIINKYNIEKNIFLILKKHLIRREK